MIRFLKDISFANAFFLWFLLIIPIFIFFYIWKWRNRTGVVRFNATYLFPRTKQTLPKLRHLLFVFQLLALLAMIVAMARPQSSLSWQNVTTEGIDIVISMDVSGSMLARDFKPNRLEATKKIGEAFVKARPNDRIGLVIFSGEAFTQCPLTTDHAVLVNLFDKVKNGMVEDGTAIGMGLATAVNRLRESTAKSKVIILLTDGVNNMGEIPPITAGQIAKQFGIRVYTVGVGRNGMAPMPVQTPFGIQYQNAPVHIDEASLKEIAESTGGKYFRATNNKKLEEIYQEIDQLEKSKINVTQFNRKNELFPLLAWFAVCMMILYFGLKNTIFKSIVS